LKRLRFSAPYKKSLVPPGNSFSTKAWRKNKQKEVDKAEESNQLTVCPESLQITNAQIHTDEVAASRVERPVNRPHFKRFACFLSKFFISEKKK
jgi:hypothetical protein